MIWNEESSAPAFGQFSGLRSDSKLLRARFSVERKSHRILCHLLSAIPDNRQIIAISPNIQQQCWLIAGVAAPGSTVRSKGLMESIVLFGRKVRSIREAAGRTREMVAEDAAITPNYLGEIERGEKWPSLDVIVSLSKTFAVSPAAFFEFEAEESDPRILREKLTRILLDRNTNQLKQALRLLNALLN